MIRRALAAAAFVLAVSAAPATAADYDVSSSAELISALALAQASAEPDKIVLAANTQFDAPAGANGFSYNGVASGALEIAGAGDSTVIACDPANDTVFNLVAAPGSWVHHLRFGTNAGGCKTSSYLLASSGANVNDVSFVPRGITRAARLGAVSSLSRATIAGNSGVLSVGVEVAAGATVLIDRVHVSGVFTGVEATQTASVQIRDSLIDLGVQSLSSGLRPAGVYFGLDAGNSQVEATLSNVTIVGTGANADGVYLLNHQDIASPAPTLSLMAKNSIMAMTGAGSRDLSCPNFDFSFGLLSVTLDHVAADRSTFLTEDCGGVGGSLTDTNKIDRATSALLLDGQHKPTAGSSAIDAGDPVFVPELGELDLAGNLRVFGPKVDLGAYEFGSSPPDAGGGGPGPGEGPGTGGDTAAALTLRFGRPVGRLKVTRKAKALGKGTKKSKPRIPVTLSAAAKVTFTLAAKPKNRRKKAKTIKGSRSISLPAGQSYLTWTGRWGRKKLKPSSYILTAKAPGLAAPVALTVKLGR